MRALYRNIADDLADRVLRGEFDSDGALPSEHDLAADYGVARGTTRHALGTLRAGGLLEARPGARWRVRSAARSQEAGRLESFAQWARAQGREPGGHVVAVRSAPATVVERRRFRVVTADDQVLHVTRVRSLDGVPVMLERTTYAPWVSAVVRSMPDWQTSVTAAMEDRFGIRIGSAASTVDAVAATQEEADRLGVPLGSALLRFQRSSVAEDGRPLESGDDRYVGGAVPLRFRSTPAWAPSPDGGGGR
ncbi:GntR family transcriptional regulator [Curtobacterium sp. L1-20]|uniref:GntR family transcriptional regulator n=1 Tax=Curtobacterium sp. L1-20 TaxID=3138181 RepID=UPI003B524086